MGLRTTFRNFYSKFLISLFIVGIPFILIHKSVQSLFGNYSINFILLILFPFLLMFIFLIIEIKKEIIIKNNSFFNYLHRNKKFNSTLFGIIALIISYFFSTVQIDYCGTLLFFVSTCFWFYLYDKIFNYIELLLIGGCFLGFALILFTSELTYLSYCNINPSEESDDKIFYWGDENTFNKTTGDKKPFIGVGGRLLSNLNVKMFNPYIKEGVDLITNSVGLRNKKNYSSKVKKHNLRILSLGDSFSTGYHVDQKLFFGYKLQKFLSENFINDSVEVLNAEISDPAYGAIYLKQYLTYWKPDIVLFGTFSNDVMQAEHLLGSERLFKIDDDGSLNTNQDYNSIFPSFNDRYIELKYPIKRTRINFTFLTILKRRIDKFFITKKISQFFSNILLENDQVRIHSYAGSYEKDGYKRLFDGSNNFGLFYKKNQNEISQIYSSFFKLISYMNKICIESEAKFILMNHPLRYQVQKRDWEIISSRWNFKNEDFNLDYHNERINSFCLENKIEFIDPVKEFRDSQIKLYQPNDSHYNEHGHSLAAEITALQISKLLK